MGTTQQENKLDKKTIILAGHVQGLMQWVLYLVVYNADRPWPPAHPWESGTSASVWDGGKDEDGGSLRFNSKAEACEFRDSQQEKESCGA